MKKTALNYVWVHYLRPDGEMEERIPDRLLQNACRVSAEHPDSDRYLWVDSLRVTDGEARRLGFIAAAYGVQIRDLRDVPSYRDCSLFDLAPVASDRKGRSVWNADYHEYLDEDNSIWAQVDLARVLVLEHCLERLHYGQAYYSDFDIENVGLKNADLGAIMARHHMVFARVNALALVENSFMGFDAESFPFLKNELVAKTMKYCQGGRANGWNAMNMAFSSDDAPRPRECLVDLCALPDLVAP